MTRVTRYAVCGRMVYLFSWDRGRPALSALTRLITNRVRTRPLRVCERTTRDEINAFCFGRLLRAAPEDLWNPCTINGLQLIFCTDLELQLSLFLTQCATATATDENNDWKNPSLQQSLYVSIRTLRCYIMHNTLRFFFLSIWFEQL